MQKIATELNKYKSKEDYLMENISAVFDSFPRKEDRWTMVEGVDIADEGDIEILGKWK